ncbi:ABC transporter substrate-binding protein [Nitrospira sp. BLG_1]|uniref:ABC transporter substrate-binding protein n=1 Tax=Nitrospira sp. BLG_1 TaxID=3395883 RepID=UPI0039BD8301
MKKRVQSSRSGQALGIFIAIALKRVSCGVLASLAACTVQASVRLGCSRAAALHGTLFGRDRGRQWVIGLCVCLLLLDVSMASAYGSKVSIMKRRPQGILTGMPFMAHVSSRAFVDDAGRRLYLAKPPARVVSLAPSITEMLFALGLGEQIVGVTEFCDYPVGAKSKAKVGYANPNMETIIGLQPDMVLAPKDFLRPDLQVKLEQLKIPVFVLDAKTLEDIPLQMHTLGAMFEKTSAANDVTQRIRQRMTELKLKVEALPTKRVLYVLNSQPLISVGPGSFIHQMIGLAGGVNVAAQAGVPYPRLSMETVLKEDPEVLIFPSGEVETVPRSEQQQWRRWDSLSAVKRQRFHEVSSNLLNRPGPRVIEGLEQLVRAIHPELFGPSVPALHP